MPQKPAVKSWFNLVRNSADEGTIDFFDEIGFWGVTAKDFVSQLRAFGPVSRLTLNLDCPGGDCNDGFTIYDAIKGTNAQVTANVTGLAASMASVIMLAADKIRIAENGRIMVHRVTSGAMGDPDELDAAARTARQFEDRIVQLYVARTGQDEATIRDWMKAQNGTWFFGQEAVDHGFADEVITGAKARAFNARWAGMFTMLPSALFDTAAPAPAPKAEIPPMKKLSEAQKARLKELLAAANLDDTEKAELQTLSDKAAAENYDATETPAAPAAASTPDISAVVTAAVSAAVTPLQAKITDIETRLSQGVTAQNLGGAPPVAGARPPGDVATIPANEAELETALRDCKTHAERMKLIADFKAARRA